MKTNTIIVLLFALVPFITIFLIIDLREGTFPRQIIFYTLLGVFGVLAMLFLNKRLEKKKKEKEQANLQ
ncbi:MAG: hypothetical protein EA362_03580 [Saprospirales bacterium]|nr:MAG: hypothetical protein EA362_03580 [Saprospirales bacterium]